MQYGPNTLRQKGPPSDVMLAVSQLKNPLIIILLVAAGITVFLGDKTDAAIILLAIAINTILGFVQERKARHSLAALKRMIVSRVRMRIGNSVRIVDALTLVPEDVVMLTSGDRVPADGRIIESAGMIVNESMLSGESMPVPKKSDDPLFMGTTVASGRATMRVETTGMNTKIGTIAGTLEELDEEPTPLQIELSRLAKLITIIVLITAAGIFLFGIFRGQTLAVMFSTAVALAVSAVPEGLAVTLTVILALGMQRILAKKAIVRRLVAAETLGSVTTLCVDKTGTLTEGVMKVTKTHLTDTNRAISAAVIANNMSDPIETALWEWAENQDHADPQRIVENETKTAELPFDSRNKYMAVQTTTCLWVKGAPEVLLEKSTLSSHQRAQWRNKIDAWAKRGLRLIAVACKEGSGNTPIESSVNNLLFLGIFGIIDPVRPEVAVALANIRAAGVSVKVITGDYRLTAEAVLTSIGLPIAEPAKEILEGIELSQLSEQDLDLRVQSIKLFCRVTPEQKLAIVSSLKRNNQVVAMTGDGVNDALAIKKADIGIVVANASDVAKETADMILLDSSFRTIVATIEEGRIIFDNIRKVTTYLLSDSLTEILLIACSLIADLPLPLTAAQILWINILSDGLPNLALAVDPKETEAMLSHPQKQRNSLFPSAVKRFIGITSTAKAALGMALFVVFGIWGNNVPLGQTIVFSFISIGSFAAAFSLRAPHRSIIRSRLFANRWLVAACGGGFILLLGALYLPQFSVFPHNVPLEAIHWMPIIGAVFLLLLVFETNKRKIHPRRITKI